MADICTLSAIMVLPAIACMPQMECHHDEAIGKTLCIPSLNAVNTCTKLPPPRYECRRPDGSVYIWTDDRR